MWKRWRKRLPNGLGDSELTVRDYLQELGRQEGMMRLTAELAVRVGQPVRELCRSTSAPQPEVDSVISDLRAVEALLRELGSGPDPERLPQDLAAELEARRDELEDSLEGPKLHLALEHRAVLHLEPRALEILLLPLLRNARDATRQRAGERCRGRRPSIHVGLSRRMLFANGRARASREPPLDVLSIWVRDEGCGMSPAVRSRAFDPFFSTRGPHRLGLGLTRVLCAVRRHGGGIRLSTQLGQGSCADLVLPLRGDQGLRP